jgi:uncharacterized membrane protein
MKVYEGVSKISELAAWGENCNGIALCHYVQLYPYLVSQSSKFAAITICVASQRVFVVVYFVIDSVRKLLDTPSYFNLVNLE